MRKKLLLTLSAALICAVATSVQAESNAPSASVLNEMGLSSLQVLSDSDALAIRGMGYKAKAWGNSEAYINKNNKADNHYNAKSNKKAKGGADSYASKRKVNKTFKKNGKLKKKTVKVKSFSAGGSSWAKAK